MWNTKALKTLGPRFQPLDRFDREAEAEGNAFRRAKAHGPAILGKRIAKNSRKANGFAATAELKATTHIVKETARIVAARTIRPMQLAQV